MYTQSQNSLLLNGIQGSDGLGSKCTWIECERDFTCLHLHKNVKSMNGKFVCLLWSWVKNLQIFAWFHVKLLKVQEFGVNENSQHRTEVKCDYAKCWKLLQVWIFHEHEFTKPFIVPMPILCEIGNEKTFVIS